MTDERVHLLDTRYRIARHDDRVVSHVAHSAAILAEQSDRHHGPTERDIDRIDHVVRIARCRDRQQHVARLSESKHLSLEYLRAAEVVRNGRQRRLICADGYRRQRRTIEFEVAGELGGHVERLGARSAIAADQQLAASAYRSRDPLRCDFDLRPLRAHLVQESGELVGIGVELVCHGGTLFGFAEHTA